MDDDLKIIKKKYGEKMMHLCRGLFSTILNNSPGILSTMLLENFAPSHYLYEDLVTTGCEIDFKNYIYDLYDKLHCTIEDSEIVVEDPVTLMKKAGYDLYVCESDDDIQKFKKYYAKGEELCTFKDGRLNKCYVYFAVRDNAERLNRGDFDNPSRQDEYGTSVISIQFTRDSSHTLSIKNRYNHTVNNPDATYSNNLDNIITGLTKSFADYYGMKQSHWSINVFEIPNYICANDGRLYKYNYEINGIYYCPNNIVIDHYRVKKYSGEKYLVMDYFILDLVNKVVINDTEDSFSNMFQEIKNINIQNKNEGKIVKITPKIGEDIIIILDRFNRIISLKNNNVQIIYDNFLIYNMVLETICLDNVTTIYDSFLQNNRRLKTISLPNVTCIKNWFMSCSSVVNVLLPKVMIIENNFLSSNRKIKLLELPALKELGNGFLLNNDELRTILLPNVEQIGHCFLSSNNVIESISLPKVKIIGGFFCYKNEIINEVFLPDIQIIGDFFLFNNKEKLNDKFIKLKKHN